MPIYTLECSYCCLRSEHMLGMNDSLDDLIKCPMCGEDMTRRNDRIYDVPQIQGDTVAGGYERYGYDIGLGEVVKNKQHREDLMKEKGLYEYAPDPEMKKHRDEAHHIRKHSKPSDPEARAAINKEYKTALDKRRDRNVRASLEKSMAD